MLGDEVKELIQWMQDHEIDLLDDEDFNLLMKKLQEDFIDAEEELTDGTEQ